MTDVTEQAAQIHAMLRAAPTATPGHRALHAKGIVATGRFEASGALAGLTGAPHLVAGTSEAETRFSHTAGDPNVSDLTPNPRGMATKLATPGGSHQLVAVSTPAFAARDGEAFIELLLARVPDPETGGPDMAKFGAFLAAHPEALPAIEYAMAPAVVASYGHLSYNGLHTFVLVDEVGGRRPFRYRWVPVEAVPAEPADVPALGPDFLADDLRARLAGGTLAFDLHVFLAGADDVLDDSTAIWPEREGIVAGTLALDRVLDDPEPVIFDPTNVVPGVELSGDPILALRRAVYGLSYADRTA